MFVSNVAGRARTEYAQLRGTPFWEERSVTDGLNGQREIHSPLPRIPHHPSPACHARRITAYPPCGTKRGWLRNAYNKPLSTRQSSVYQMHTHSFVRLNKVCRQLFAQSYDTRPAHRLKRSLPSSKNLIRQLSLSFTLSPCMRPWLINATHRCFCFMLQ